MTTRNPVHSMGAFKTFYHFRRTLSTANAHKYVKEFVLAAPTHYGPNPLDMNARRTLTAQYERGTYTGD